LRFGVCIPLEQAAVAAAAGWDFVEEIVLNFLTAQVPDDHWTGAVRAQQSPLPVLAANRLLPPTLKVTGPKVDSAALKKYMGIVVPRAQAAGIKILVFGSGPARLVTLGFDRERARQQIIDFCRMAADICSAHNIVLVIEPMCRGESNIINSVAEAMEYVRAVNHPACKCLVDSYHSWLENEPITEVERAMPWIAHVHLADVEDRRAPGETAQHDYRPLFAALQRGKYAGLITVESNDLAQFPDGAASVLSFLKQQWTQALQETRPC
jgi:sugar phosphate isomerase/epimerase